MIVKKAIAIGVLAVAAVGLVILLTSVPAERRITIAFQGTLPATIEHAKELVDSPVARFIDPEGHDRLARALAIEARVAAGGSREIDEMGPYVNVALATEHHQMVIHRARLLGIAALAMIFVGSLIGFVLWQLDRRTGLWLGATTLLSLSFLPIGYAYASSPRLSLSLLVLLGGAIGTVGRQVVTAMRLRRPEEIP
ncbi:MAG TPA: hypothetical protein VK932_10100 [Kofleriaceae bacterium]|nr:hypothetical protein [Kofleriaceae bacterium]